VAVLEHDTETRIHDLRFILGVAIAVTLLVVIIALFMLHRALLRPLNGLLDAARRIAGGDFGVRVGYTGEDELGRVGNAFNLMADELARHYHSLEQRVADKTAELQRSNRSLELLYHAIARLYQSPTAVEAYEATLRDIDRVAGLEGSFVCIEPRHGGPATVVASSIGPCPDRAARGDEACNACRAASGGDGWRCTTRRCCAFRCATASTITACCACRCPTGCGSRTGSASSSRRCRAIWAWRSARPGAASRSACWRCRRSAR